uniref:protein-L-isoaspartate(D-aspartate) O-methyltransferase n=1 Tax=Fibrocapsa japonica TaxID=94617 RepID=A0A7S2XWK2_9STRA|mmetsp:Transcript_15648/g.22998  ORF Transcript_15648/g.22998 Transcript_15648/m.22998 type:complete len:307 (+) Transcript_15648:283-1203(+)|eukprot:CAMPEP_0113941332 /NCGR_PEP_ID=MMETSP1339-20121228/7272_1 /TAXON_ID=94617 /ORGANISM="Fibrocapsa japonica" /LENGTH=306 /DNA_ID=CAMNT_0000945445 /DNA_START=213 /DNA_END=1133 /DNA_ORIENTATION=- /assembly_acc=CAM_ASM_000762
MFRSSFFTAIQWISTPSGAAAGKSKKAFSSTTSPWFSWVWPMILMTTAVLCGMTGRTSQASGLGAWECSGDTNEELVENLVRGDLVKTEEVKKAMLAVDRAHYTNERGAYEDRPQRIGFGATISAPHMHAHALELLADHVMRPASHVLDVGSGSGYLTACLGRLQEQAEKVSGAEGTEAGLVIGIDYLEGLVSMSRVNLKRRDADLLQPRPGGMPARVKIVPGDGWKGMPEHAPYDAIHVGAAAVEIPEALVRQLKVGGRMVIPVGPQDGVQMLYQVDCTSNEEPIADSYRAVPLMGVRYVPLVQE